MAKFIEIKVSDDVYILNCSSIKSIGKNKETNKAIIQFFEEQRFSGYKSKQLIIEDDFDDLKTRILS